MIAYPDSVRFLYALGNEIKTAKLGLERVERLLAALGDPHRACRFVHVAGTNGKGSTCAMIEAALRARAVRTGLFTSPHLVEPTERIRIDGVPVSADEFAAAFSEVHAAAERLIDEGALELHPSYFETVTAMAFVLFRARGVETAALEVGLGGRLDATNVVTPALAVITPVDFDHEAWLGHTIESIAFEKAGILKPGVVAVIAAQRAEARAVIEDRAAAVGAPLEWASGWAIQDLELNAAGSRFRLARGGETIPVRCPLRGGHQIENARTAAAALRVLGLDAAAIEDGIARTEWPGRLEKVADAPEILLDGAHNPAGARALADYIRRFYGGRRVWLIYGVLRDKSVAEMVETLFPLAHEVVLAAPGTPRALRSEAIAQMASHPRLRIAPGVERALAMVRAEAAPEDAVFVTGSLFLVGEARRLLV